jgi:ribosomal protein S18 acetylase RimI-like enzyme
VAATHDHPDRRFDAMAADGSPRADAIGDRGFVAYAWSAMMVRSNLRDIPAAPLPDGLEVRPVDEAQLRTIWEADVEAFRDHRFEREQTDSDWEIFRATAGDTSLWHVAWDGDGIAGQIRTYVIAGESERLGRRRAWTESISTRRDWRGRGVASAVIAASLRQLAALGYDEAALGVDLDNPTGALGVYERLGYQVVKRYSAYSRPITAAASP